MGEPLELWSIVVPPDWIDYNGHLTEGYYGVAFGHASDAILSHLGFDESYLADYGTFYTAETHIRYLQEVHEGSQIACSSILLAADAKRLHVHHDLVIAGTTDPVATQESMMLHVSDPGPRVSAMHEPVLGAALALAAAHASLPRPDRLGQGVRQLPGSGGS
jgi:acyl-CoA thioesterase FadM